MEQRVCSMVTYMAAHLWQSTILAGVAWLVTLALKRNRAQVRYWVWFAASVKFLAPLTLLVAVGELAPKHAAGPVVQTHWVVAVEEIGRPLAVLPIAPDAARDYSVPIGAGLWACGFAVMLVSFGRKWTRMKENVRTSHPMQLDFPVPVRSSPELYEPGVFGAFRPILLLPEGIAERLSPAQFQAVLAHELCHVRRRDNLTAMIHTIVQAIFWFHPLVWWIGIRLIEERERACDEEVLRLGSSPQDYAEGILNVCKLYVESPVACVSGVTGSDLKKRIEAIMRNPIVLRLNPAKKAVLAAIAVAAIALPVAVGMLRAQSAPSAKFEVASIRPCELAPPTPGPPPLPTPGRLSQCATVMSFIMQAYGRFATGHFNPNLRSFGVDGGPAWSKSAGYQITAKAEGDVSEDIMRGPMMQALLQDRFKLKLHHETREMPFYALTEAKGGAKLKAFTPGVCTAPDLSKVPLPPPAPAQTYCDYRVGRKGSAVALDAQGRSLDDLSTLLGVALDRPVTNRTGIAGVFDMHLQFAIDETTPQFRDPGAAVGNAASEPAGGPSVFTAIQEQLGLKLDPVKEPGDFVVIDSVDRPTDN
jgi:bla regulator protein blaR1